MSGDSKYDWASDNASIIHHNNRGGNTPTCGTPNWTRGIDDWTQVNCPDCEERRVWRSGVVVHLIDGYSVKCGDFQSGDQISGLEEEVTCQRCLRVVQWGFDRVKDEDVRCVHYMDMRRMMSACGNSQKFLEAFRISYTSNWKGVTCPRCLDTRFGKNEVKQRISAVRELSLWEHWQVAKGCSEGIYYLARWASAALSGNRVVPRFSMLDV